MQPRGQQRRAIPGTVPLRSTAACAGATELRFPRKLTSLLPRCCSALTTKVCSCCDAITSRVPPTLQFLLPMLLYSLCPRRRHEAPRRPCPWRYGVAKGWSPSGGLVSGPLAASASLCSVLSLASSLSCIPSSLFSSLYVITPWTGLGPRSFRKSDNSNCQKTVRTSCPTLRGGRTLALERLLRRLGPKPMKATLSLSLGAPRT